MPLAHTREHTHTHILTFSGYLGRQVVVPLPVAKQLPSPLPLQHARNVSFFFSFFPLCVFVCRLGCERAFIKAATVNKKHNLPRKRLVFSCCKPPPPVADPLCTFYFFSQYKKTITVHVVTSRLLGGSDI